MDEPYPFPPRSLLIAAGATALCCIWALWVRRSTDGGVLRRPRRKRRCSCSCSCSCACVCGGAGCGGGADRDSFGGDGGTAVGDKKATVAEWQAGGSMMEQLVPEITTHALSYLDYTSLCRLSMTNSAMRRAANDDGAWKALFHKDFTVEQDTVNPSNGWKAYYAATKAITNINAEFYNIIRERSLPAMSRLWLNADYVKCMHGSGELFTGYGAVIDSWALALNWGQGGGQEIDLQVRDVRARILDGMAWVTMTTYIGVDLEAYYVTNIYEFHDGRWYMVHHQSSMMLG
ncbi:F-box protein [Musa troglodytarum]|uniref:F-box protein n=1 Tax=Musa troglodytarum TaxID=320322 RepID=A0A9E7EBF6_9LILI|nr:F-box protein [Musa troglodytarum]